MSNSVNEASWHYRIEQILLQILSAIGGVATAQSLNQAQSVNQSVGSGRLYSITQAQLTANKITFLGVDATVFNPDGFQVEVDTRRVPTNSVEIDFTGLTPLTQPWSVLVR